MPKEERDFGLVQFESHCGAADFAHSCNILCTTQQTTRSYGVNLPFKIWIVVYGSLGLKKKIKTHKQLSKMNLICDKL